MAVYSQAKELKSSKQLKDYQQFTRRTHQIDQIDQIDHDLDHLDPNLSVSYVVQDLYRADTTQEKCARSCRSCGSHPAARATGIIDHTDQEYISLPCLEDLHHEL